jgi:hypothetical protein
MKTTKITGEQVALLQTFQAARDKKNEGTREEKNARKAVDNEIPELAQKLDEYSLMFNGAPCATWTMGERTALDEGKLQAEFPEAFKACYLPGKVWALKVF